MTISFQIEYRASFRSDSSGIAVIEIERENHRGAMAPGTRFVSKIDR
jgi:hypothetical protein